MAITKKDYPNLSSTKIRLINAVLYFLEKEEYAETTILQIVQVADVARSSFYNNFRTKDDILRCFIEEIYVKTQTHIGINPAISMVDLLHMYYDFMKKNKTFLILLYKNNLFHLVLEENEFWIRHIIIEQKYDILDKTDCSDFVKENKEYYARFLSAGTWSVLKLWVQGGMQESTDHMVRLILDLMRYQLK